MLGGNNVTHLLHHVAEPLHLFRAAETLQQSTLSANCALACHSQKPGKLNKKSNHT